MSNLNKAQYESAATKYFSQDPEGQLNFQKYYGPTLLATVVAEMQSSLPSVVAARLAFQRLVTNGRLQRTDGKDEAFDRAEAVAAAQSNLAEVISQVDSAPLSRDELNYFGSLNQRELSRFYYGEDGDALCEFAIRYNRACRELGFVVPPRFSDQGSR
jgi:hypothetical protein